MTKREQRVINAFCNCVRSGEFSPDYAITLIEDRQRYGWLSETAIDAFYAFLDAYAPAEPEAPALPETPEEEPAEDPAAEPEEEPAEDPAAEPEEEPAEDPEETPADEEPPADPEEGAPEQEA